MASKWGISIHVALGISDNRWEGRLSQGIQWVAEGLGMGMLCRWVYNRALGIRIAAGLAWLGIRVVAQGIDSYTGLLQGFARVSCRGGKGSNGGVSESASGKHNGRSSVLLSVLIRFGVAG
jgi:hypothetical protein